MTGTVIKPWYREPWPWLLMAGPGIVVIAGIVTWWLAVVSFDGLVVGDYYKQGLAINQTLDRDHAARRMGLSATVSIEAASGELSVRLVGMEPPPERISISILHPGTPDKDYKEMMLPLKQGVYIGSLPALPDGKRYLLIEDGTRSWRLAGEWFGASGTALLTPPR